jgi:hypothetical protein
MLNGHSRLTATDLNQLYFTKPIPVAARPKAWYAAARLLGLGVRIPRGRGCLSLVSVVCCQVEVSASGWSLIQRSPTECGVYNWVWPWSIDKRRPWPNRGCWATKKIYIYMNLTQQLRNFHYWWNERVQKNVSNPHISQVTSIGTVTDTW